MEQHAEAELSSRFRKPTCGPGLLSGEMGGPRRDLGVIPTQTRGEGLALRVS